MAGRFAATTKLPGEVSVRLLAPGGARCSPALPALFLFPDVMIMPGLQRVTWGREADCDRPHVHSIRVHVIIQSSSDSCTRPPLADRWHFP